MKALWCCNGYDEDDEVGIWTIIIEIEVTYEWPVLKSVCLYLCTDQA